MYINAIRHIKYSVQCLAFLITLVVVVLILETSVTFLLTAILTLYTILVCDVAKDRDVVTVKSGDNTKLKGKS